MDHGFHRTPLVQGCLEVLQHVSPGAASLAQCHLPNKPYSLCCAAQYYRRASADTQLRINGKVRHGHLTPVPLPKFHPRSNFVSKITPCFRHRPRPARSPRRKSLTGVREWPDENHPTSKLTRRIKYGQRTQSPKGTDGEKRSGSGGVTENGTGSSRRGRCRRLRQALDCLRPSKVHPEWIR